MTTIENSGPAGAPELRLWGPDSLSWRQGIDWKTAFTARAVLLLQVAHPVAALLRLTTAGYLLPPLRARFGIDWDTGRAGVAVASAEFRADMP
ncbi:hypothetical protein [Nocardia jinanensis]|uniref:DUF2236 domain-containing protein n=1 Tax=Nocardia jinanensis TaxID=382504 RepID=A0A917RWA7_9NOCA|nr:hypothetical protein [Nocardia jinanensis]GGL39377.1 hypothetical protein GCM10011588_62630 [Nocardia jinanensis]